MAVTVSGMFGSGHTYFAGSPVVIDISGLYWGANVTSPFTVVRVEVIYNGNVVGEFKADTGGQTSISFDISSALRAIWSDYTFSAEITAAQNVAAASQRAYRPYSLAIYTEYIDSQDGEFTQTSCGTFTGGQCAIGWLTEMERSNIGNKANADASHWEHTNNRNGDASTKPGSSPERVGSTSITSYTDVSNSGTTSVFYSHLVTPAADSQSAHAPMVLRDTIPYVDFLFVNRRGAVETCSARIKEGMTIDVDSKQYARVERPTFKPSRSIMAIASGGRRSWEMSSGYQDREWAEWWTLEFLMARQWWMRYPIGDANGTFVPVIVEPEKKSTGIYDKVKQQMPHVDFTVTLALEG